MDSSPAYILTSTAERDFRNAKRWSNKRWGKEQTRFYFKELDKAANYIAENHESIARKDYLTGSTGLGVYPAKEHYIIYISVDRKTIIIVALIRQSCDVPAILEANNFRISREIAEIKTLLRSEDTTDVL